MSTTWYCVDEEGNVGFFDIADDGPVPEGDYKENCFEEVFWEELAEESETPFKELHLRHEQVLPILEPNEERGIWQKDKWGWNNYEWMDTIIKIDMSKFDLLKQAVTLKKRIDSPICISKELGLFLIQFHRNKEGVELLEKNHVIIAKYLAPRFNFPYYEDDGDIEKMKRDNQKFPVYIYYQDFCPSNDPAEKVNRPEHPLKIEQLPINIQKRIKKLPIKFKEHDRIQLAELLPVDCIWSPRYVYNNRIWWQLASSKGGKIYYNESTHTLILGEIMDRLLAEGKAEEWDYHKHNDIPH